MECFECGSSNNIEMHHIIPNSLGGTKTIPLCFRCHDKAHGKKGRKSSASELTKKALAELKAKGVKLGSPQNLTTAARAKGVEAAKAAARNNKANKQAGELVTMYREKGLTLQAIADKLNKAGYTTRRGKQFKTTTVLRLAKMYAQ